MRRYIDFKTGVGTITLDDGTERIMTVEEIEQMGNDWRTGGLTFPPPNYPYATAIAARDTEIEENNV